MPDRPTDPRAQVASLGCGTLILVALIVFFVGRWSNAPLFDEVEALRADVHQLQAEVQSMHAHLRPQGAEAESRAPESAAHGGDTSHEDEPR